MNTFAFVYNSEMAADRNRQLLSFIKNHRDVDSWSNPSPGFFFLRSNKSANELKDSFYEFFDGYVTFMVIEMAPQKASGAMSQEFWDWLNLGTSAQLEDKAEL